MKYFDEIMRVLASIPITIGTRTLTLGDIKTEEELCHLTSKITRFLPYEGKTAVEQGVCPSPANCPDAATCTKEFCDLKSYGQK